MIPAGGQAAGAGLFTSRVFDAYSMTAWTNFTWMPARPSYKALPDSNAVENGYPTGNVNMAGNLLLLHFSKGDYFWLIIIV